MEEQRFDPTHHPVERIRASPTEAPETDPSALKQLIAEKVRACSRDLAAPAAEHVVQQLAPDLPRERLGELLAEMAAEEGFGDIKAVVAPSGRIYLFSDASLARNDAAEKCFLEEVKIAIVEKVRKDSLLIALTPMADLERFFPWPEPEKRLALVAELRADERFRDIQSITGPGGELYLHSDDHVSSNYGKIMVRAKANRPGLSIAEFVRDRSRVMPAPTQVAVFRDAAFALSPAQVEAFLDGLARPEPEFADIKKLVHPTTGAVYLYSDKWLDEANAFRIMDWDEVGRAQNP